MGSWRARCLAIGTPGSEVRAGETDRPKGQHRAPARPYFHALCEAEQLEVLLVNARHVKNVPGRKTDAKDAEWLAQLCEVGLLRGSFIPPAEMGVAPSQGPADLATWRSGGSAMTLPGRCAGWEAAMRFVPGPLEATGQGPHTCGWDGSRPTAARFDPKDHNGGHACISHLGCNGELPAANAAPAADAWVGRWCPRASCWQRRGAPAPRPAEQQDPTRHRTASSPGQAVPEIEPHPTGVGSRASRASRPQARSRPP